MSAAGDADAHATTTDVRLVGCPGRPLQHFTHAPLRGIEPDGGSQWLASNHDPQFHLTLPTPQAAGFYVITARLHVARDRSPCVYLDLGRGWSEASRFDLLPHDGRAQWSTLLDLPAWHSSVRFDPTDSAGGFHFAGAAVQQLSAAEALTWLMDQDQGASSSRSTQALRALVRAGRPINAPALVRAMLAGRDNSASPTLPVDGYADWIRCHDTLTDVRIGALRTAVVALPTRPLLSLLMPTSGLEPSRLEACVDALLAQVYPDWELCIIAAPGAAPAVDEAIVRQVGRSSRIRVMRAPADVLPDQGACLALALDAAQGALAAVIDDRLQLAPHALLMMVDAAHGRPDAQMFYADEDRLTAHGARVDPYFKPEWDGMLALTHDLPGALVLCRMAALRSACAAALQAGLVSARTLALHCTARLSATRVVHLPHVLSHVAERHDSVDTEDGEPDRDVASYLAATDPEARLRVATAGVPRVTHPLPMPLPKVSIVIPTRDRVDLLRRCVDSILSRSSYANLEIAVVDNQSSDPDTLAYFDAVQSDTRVRVLAYDRPFNYSAINNFAVERVDGEVIALLNNDVEVISTDWIEEMLQYALRPEIGAVGAMLYYPDDTIQHAGVVIGLGGVAGHAYSHQPRGFAGQRGRARHVQRLGAVTAACLLVRRESYLQVGGLDETLAIAFNDIDFCLRLAEAGLATVWTPHAELYHHESASRGTEDTPDKQARFAGEVAAMIDRWSRQLASDRSYNPNLSLAFDDAFALSASPRSTLENRMGRLASQSVQQAR